MVAAIHLAVRAKYDLTVYICLQFSRPISTNFPMVSAPVRLGIWCDRPYVNRQPKTAQTLYAKGLLALECPSEISVCRAALSSFTANFRKIFTANYSD